MPTYDPKSSGSQGMTNTPATSEGANPGATSGSPVDKARETTSQAVDTVKQTAGQAVDTVKQTTGQAVDKAKEAAAPVVDQAKQTATSQLTDRKDMAAESLGSVADTLRQTGRQLERGQGQAFAGVATAAADQVESLSAYLRDRDVTDLIRDVENFARRQPVLFLSGAFALGLLGARFLKSSSANISSQYYEGGPYGAGGYGATGTYRTGGMYRTGDASGAGGAYQSGSTYGTGGTYQSGSTYGTGSSVGSEPRPGYRETYQGYVNEDAFDAPRYGANEALRPDRTGEE